MSGRFGTPANGVRTWDSEYLYRQTVLDAVCPWALHSCALTLSDGAGSAGARTLGFARSRTESSELNEPDSTLSSSLGRLMEGRGRYIEGLSSCLGISPY